MCEIRGVSIRASAVSSPGAPSQLEVTLDVEGCDAVNVTLRFGREGSPTYSITDFQPGPPDSPRVWSFPTVDAWEVECLKGIHVEIECVADPECRAEFNALVDCNPEDLPVGDGDDVWEALPDPVAVQLPRCGPFRWLMAAGLLLGAIFLQIASCPAFFAWALPIALIALAAGGAAALLVRAFCWGNCAVVQVATWVCKWAGFLGIPLGIGLSVACLNVLPLLVGLGYGVLAGLLVFESDRMGCPEGEARGSP